MKDFRKTLLIALFAVSVCIVGCDMNAPNEVTVTFDLNGGTINTSTSNQVREGTEGKYFKLPKPEYITNKEYDSVSDITNVYGKKFEGWVLKGTSTIIYNEYDSYGAFPEEDKTYVATWGTEVLLYDENGNTED